MADAPTEIQAELKDLESKFDAHVTTHTNEVAIADWLKTLVAMLSKKHTMTEQEKLSFFAEFHSFAGRLNTQRGRIPTINK